jgi:DNA-binding response OmpR family regulator
MNRLEKEKKLKDIGGAIVERILVIEDEEPIAELIRINLEMAGYEVLLAMDGEEGLRLVKANRFDLVLLDIMLPKIDGYCLLPQILERKIPVIILTAKGSLKDRVVGLNMGADDYIVKPFEGMELIARIKVILRRVNKEDKLCGFDT